MAFAGAAWSTRPNVQVLSSAVPFHFHSSDDAAQLRAARHIAAFKRAADKLKLYYEQGLATEANENHSYPHPTAYQVLGESTQQHFRYVSPMPGGNLIFECQLRNRCRICVKFARSYSQKVHEFCAKGNFAPKLLGYETIPGGWHMVVMEHLGEDYVDFDPYTVNQASQDDFEKNIASLHQAGYVHGDIRCVNTMMPTNGKGPIKLIDFEWAGEDAYVRYPAHVHSGIDLWRPEGAVDNEPITVAHDIAMLHEMFRWTRKGLSVR